MLQEQGVSGSPSAGNEDTTHDTTASKAKIALDFAQQAKKLGLDKHVQDGTQAVEAQFVTAQDPIIETENGGRLPAVPLSEAIKLNRLRDALEDTTPGQRDPTHFGLREAKDGTVHGIHPPDELRPAQSSKSDAPLGISIPPTRTNPLFPPLPIICRGGRCFEKRPFYEEEKKRAAIRLEAEQSWHEKSSPQSSQGEKEEMTEFEPTEGGPDPLLCDVSYYARRVGLDCETFEVQTEDGFIIELWHLYNPRETMPKSDEAHQIHEPNNFGSPPVQSPMEKRSRKYPVLLIHGLLQSSGAYCCMDDTSLAFYLAKSGLDVWLGNNRCGFKPRHTMLSTSDPRHWLWNIRQMGCLDLPALISRVLHETGFDKLAMIAHSQGTTQTLVALAKEQRPEIGEKISLVCLLAPAAYAGPLIDKMILKFMGVISPALFRIIFGIHAFIPFMMDMHRLLPARFYGFMGYRVFSFLFNWTDKRWDRGLRDRAFQFAPVYVSAESMRWWLGRECFAKQRCILSTRDEVRIEDREDTEADTLPHTQEEDDDAQSPERPRVAKDDATREEMGRYAWYDERVPPFAIFVAGSDDLVDGRRLLRRFHRGREPHVRIVYEKIIPDYEHLDVIWAIDVIEQVGKDALECIWKTIPDQYRGNVRIPRGCEDVDFIDIER